MFSLNNRGQKDRRSDNKCESDYSGAAEAAASLEEKSGIDVHHANGGECMTEKSESDYASESWFEEETVTTCEGDQKGKIFNEEMNGNNKSFTHMWDAIQ